MQNFIHTFRSYYISLNHQIFVNFKTSIKTLSFKENHIISKKICFFLLKTANHNAKKVTTSIEGLVNNPPLNQRL